MMDENNLQSIAKNNKDMIENMKIEYNYILK